ncbi:MAG: nucleotide exchange factor GrpE [Theionarchaea archaeon]|nr:nucleotide exchange factor GrpE [Theionarchaea archaeon]MBU7038416.1 nucleotide exchange factor GrpE [Theionarchaea archaeon]
MDKKERSGMQPETNAQPADDEGEPVSESIEVPPQCQEEIDALCREIEEQDRTVKEYLSTLQRLQAEFENYKKRVERERIEYTEQANTALLEKLLPVLDNFERALNAESSDIHSLRKGLEMIFSQFRKILEGEGLSSIDALGEEFDPYYHEAVLVACGDYEDDTVIEVLEKGYMFKHRCLRPSKVKVGKRGD